MADLVIQERGWPTSRLQLFQRACERMVKEYNEEHLIPQRPITSTADLLCLAGQISAVQLISGAAGYSLQHHESRAEYLTLDIFERETPASLRQVLATKLFAVQSMQRLTFVHRHVAEFLAAMYLSRLVQEKKLPIKRITSLIVGEDGTVVTPFHGLSAWLSLQSRTARQILIEIDPIGVGLYGDLHEYSRSEKRKLLDSLRHKGRQLGNRFEMSAAFGSLVSADMESILKKLLTSKCKNLEHQGFLVFLLRALCHGPKLSRISPALIEIIYDETWYAAYAKMH